MDNDAEPRRERELLTEFLAGRNVACPVCGYNLRGLASPICPECGAHLDLRVGSVDRRLGAWLTTLLSLALPFGFFGIGLIVIVVLSTYWGEWPSAEFMLAITCSTVAYGVLVWGILASRRRYWSMTQVKRCAVAIASVLVNCVIVSLLIHWMLEAG